MVYFTTPQSESEDFAAQRHLTELSERYSRLVMEYAELSGPRARALEAEYQLAFGQKEARIAELMLSVQRLKREFSLRQAAAAHGKRLADAVVEEQLAQEFHEYQEKVTKMLKMVQSAKEFMGGRSLSSEEVQKLKRVFRQLAKELHPDLNPDLPPLARELWNRALEAYKGNHLDELLLVEDMAEELLAGMQRDEKPTDTPDALQQRIVKLEGKIAELQAQIATTKGRFPFTEAELLVNPAAVLERRKELDQQIAAWESQLKELEKIVAELRQGGQANG